MRLLFCGDVVGRSGREAIKKHIPELRKQLKLDCVVVNGENAASGFGITESILNQFFKDGADVVTGGDHIFDRKEVLGFINNYSNLLRPANFPEHTAGRGHYEFETPEGKKVLVIHLMAQLFMKYQLECPFAKADEILKSYRLGKNVDAIIVDFHGEATSEMMAMAHHLDGRVSMVTGSHTHVPTADIQILPGGTAQQSDAGMCGDYNSVIGFDKEMPVKQFLQKFKGGKLEPASGEATVCGIYIETDNKTGLTTRVEAVRKGGRLSQAVPDISAA